MLRSLKAYFISLTYLFISRLVNVFSVTKQTNRLVIIKTDEIGDYFLFRNLLDIIRHSEKYKSYDITLIANVAWKDVFYMFDKATVDNTIWVNKKEFTKNLTYRFTLLKKIRKEGFTDVINCIFSRSFFIDDAFVSVISANNCIGMISDLSNKAEGGINTAVSKYTCLIDSGSPSLFDAYRNLNFIANILGVDPDKIGCSVDVPIVSAVKEDFFIVFPGAGKPGKKWLPQYFAEVINYTVSKYNLKPILLGSKADIEDSDALLAILGSQVENYTGKMSIPESLALLSKAKFALSVDTGSVHMAAAVKCPVIALYSGTHYGRFAPYPQAVSKRFYSIYPNAVDELVEDQKIYSLNITTEIPFEDIKKIQPNKVVPYVDTVMDFC